MKDHPIIFSAPMVLALIAGRKTMTRRLAETPPKFEDDVCVRDARPSIWTKVKPGDRLWVRENFALVGGGDPGLPIYAANWREDAEARGFENIPTDAPKWTPCIHLPRWASRLTLAVTSAKIEPIQSITDDDAILEGITRCDNGRDWWDGFDIRTASSTPRGAFYCLWIKLHGQESWGSNPEVVAISFDVHERNIDSAA